MAFIQTRIVGPTTLVTTAGPTTIPGTELFEVAPNTVEIIKQMIITNITASAKTVTVWLVPHGVSSSNAHIVLHDFLINANETTLINWSLVMKENAGVGDKLYARASAASSVNFIVNSVTEDGT